MFEQTSIGNEQVKYPRETLPSRSNGQVLPDRLDNSGNAVFESMQQAVTSEYRFDWTKGGISFQ